MNPVVHFEMPYEDKDRMVKFYEEAFGWKATVMGPEFGDYIVVHTSETDEKGMIKTPGRINGGFYKRTVPKAEVEEQSPCLVISVEDIQASMKAVEQAGGKVIGGGRKLGEPDDIPGIGLYISIWDTEKNRVGMLQPSAQM